MLHCREVLREKRRFGKEKMRHLKGLLRGEVLQQIMPQPTQQEQLARIRTLQQEWERDIARINQVSDLEQHTYVMRRLNLPDEGYWTHDAVRGYRHIVNAFEMTDATLTTSQREQLRAMQEIMENVEVAASRIRNRPGYIVTQQAIDTHIRDSLQELNGRGVVYLPSGHATHANITRIQRQPDGSYTLTLYDSGHETNVTRMQDGRAVSTAVQEWRLRPGTNIEDLMRADAYKGFNPHGEPNYNRARAHIDSMLEQPPVRIVEDFAQRRSNCTTRGQRIFMQDFLQNEALAGRVHQFTTEAVRSPFHVPLALAQREQEIQQGRIYPGNQRPADLDVAEWLPYESGAFGESYRMNQGFAANNLQVTAQMQAYAERLATEGIEIQWGWKNNQAFAYVSAENVDSFHRIERNRSHFNAIPIPEPVTIRVRDWSAYESSAFGNSLRYQTPFSDTDEIGMRYFEASMREEGIAIEWGRKGSEMYAYIPQTDRASIANLRNASALHGRADSAADYSRAASDAVIAVSNDSALGHGVHAAYDQPRLSGAPAMASGARASLAQDGAPANDEMRVGSVELNPRSQVQPVPAQPHPASRVPRTGEADPVVPTPANDQAPSAAPRTRAAVETPIAVNDNPARAARTHIPHAPANTAERLMDRLPNWLEDTVRQAAHAADGARGMRVLARGLKSLPAIGVAGGVAIAAYTLIRAEEAHARGELSDEQMNGVRAGAAAITGTSAGGAFTGIATEEGVDAVLRRLNVPEQFRFGTTREDAVGLMQTMGETMARPMIEGHEAAVRIERGEGPEGREQGQPLTTVQRQSRAATARAAGGAALAGAAGMPVGDITPVVGMVREWWADRQLNSAIGDLTDDMQRGGFVPSVDRDGNGRISTQEIQRFVGADGMQELRLAQESGGGLSAAELRGVMLRQLAQNQNASITSRLRELEQRGWKTFLDADRDGRLELSDIRATMARHGIRMSEVDRNADGNITGRELTDAFVAHRVNRPDGQGRE